ncbi:MAG: carboxypeptidase regulatory-like domain-containing protein [Armatimonadetes bacterium]|nr:carboxypeptidase regulatory-like domain-containing protein [Armatimonadota bacterium]
MFTSRRPLLAVAALLLSTLWGCGGGGGSADKLGFGSLSGSVFIQRDALASGAGAEAIQISVEGAALSATAAPDGSFTLDGVPEGYQTVVARTTSKAASLVAQVRRGRRTDVGDVILADAGQISGLVTSSADKSPIAGARVMVTSAVMSNTADVLPLPVRHARTDAAGSYTVRGLLPGSYTATIEKPGFVATSLLLDVRQGATTAGDAAMDPAPTEAGGSVAGVVTAVNAAGESIPVAGALVWLHTGDVVIQNMPPIRDGVGSAVWPPPFYAITDDQGAYQIANVPAGDVTVTASRSGFEPATGKATIVAGKTASVDLVLRPHAPGVGNIAGVVTDKATGAAIAGATVAARFQAPPPPPSDGSGGSTGSSGGGFVPGDMVLATETDANGKYSLTVPAGERLLAVHSNGYRIATQTVTVTAGADVQADVALEPLPAGERFTVGGVAVVMRDGAEVPASGAHVVLSSVTDPTMDGSGRPVAAFHVRAGADGTFQLKAPAGEYTVCAVLRDLSSVPAPLTVSGDTRVKVVLEKMIGL